MTQRLASPLSVAAVATLVVAFTAGCGGGPAAPFDTLKTANLTAYRLQNYEPPAPAPGAAPGAASPFPMMPGLPPQLQQCMQQGPACLGQFVPPGLIPPGLFPPMGAPPPAVAPTPAQDTTPRFQSFRILSQTQVIDSKLKEQLADILGDDGNFGNEHAPCMYPELGLRFESAPGAPPNDVLISFLCKQVGSSGFQWPHKYTGMTDNTVKELSAVANKLWPPGA